MTTVTAPANYAGLSQLATASTRLSSQYTSLEAELSSGVSSSTFGGFGSGTYAALDLQPAITGVTAWQSNVTYAQSSLTTTQTALSSISDIVTSLQTSLTALQTNPDTEEVTAAAAEARSSLSSLTALLDTKDGDQYVFSGTASSTPPVAGSGDLATSSYFSAVGAQVASLDDDNASDVEANLAALSAPASATSVFSAALDVTPADAASMTHSVSVGTNMSVQTGFVATASAPGETSGLSTGSPIRDLIQALSVVGNLDQADSNSAGFTSLVDATASQVQGVSTGLINVTASLGQSQSTLTSQSSLLSDMSDALTTQLGSIKDSDAASLSTQISDTSTQLQASYNLIADMKGMTLAAYL